MGRFVTIGEVEQTAPPYMWRPMTTPPKFVVLAPSALASEDMPTPSAKASPEIVDIIEEVVVDDVPTPIMEAAPTPIIEDMAEALGEAVEAPETLVEALAHPCRRRGYSSHGRAHGGHRGAHGGDSPLPQPA